MGKWGGRQVGQGRSEDVSIVYPAGSEPSAEGVAELIGEVFISEDLNKRSFVCGSDEP